MIAPSAIARPAAAHAPAPISYANMAWLAVAYAATFAFYVLAIGRLWGVEVAAVDG